MEKQLRDGLKNEFVEQCMDVLTGLNVQSTGVNNTVIKVIIIVPLLYNIKCSIGGFI